MLFASSLLYAQVPNGDFENWYIDRGSDKMIPNDWNSPGFQGCFEMPSMAEQSTDAYEGLYAASIGTQYAGIAGIPIPGWLFNGDVAYDHNNDPVPMGSSIKDVPTRVGFAFKYDTEDHAQYGLVKVEVYSNSQLLATGEDKLYYTNSGWQRKSVYLKYNQSNAVPQRIVIQFFSNDTTGNKTNIKMATLTVDDVAVSYKNDGPCEELFTASYDGSLNDLYINFRTCVYHGPQVDQGWCACCVEGSEYMDFVYTPPPIKVEVLDLQGRSRFIGELQNGRVKTVFRQLELETGVYIARVYTVYGDKSYHINQAKFISGK